MEALIPNARVKKWVKALLEHKQEISSAIGMPLGDLLGCGHWGCVVDLTSPWVLKLTIDPTEAHIWKKIAELIEEECYGAAGFPRLLEIYELDPGIVYGGRRKRTYAIVREAVQPVFDVRPNGQAFLSDHTVRRLGIPEGTEIAAHELKSSAGFYEKNYKLQEFADTIDGLLDYRRIAWDWHAGHKDGYTHARLERATYRMSGPIGGALGESLLMLLQSDVVLNDVHLGNVGWREHEQIGDSYMDRCLVIFDPGHTPTAKRSIAGTISWASSD